MAEIGPRNSYGAGRRSRPPASPVPAAFPSCGIANARPSPRGGEAGDQVRDAECAGQNRHLRLPEIRYAADIRDGGQRSARTSFSIFADGGGLPFRRRPVLGMKPPGRRNRPHRARPLFGRHGPEVYPSKGGTGGTGREPGSSGPPGESPDRNPHTVSVRARGRRPIAGGGPHGAPLPRPLEDRHRSGPVPANDPQPVGLF